MSRWVLTAGLVAGLALGVGVAVAGPEHDHGEDRTTAQDVTKTIPKCPVMGEPINLAVSVATDDGPVFFCCKDCVAKYQANPAKYAAKAAAQRAALAGRPKVQVTCPVSGEPVDRKTFIEKNGEKIYFCSKGCVNKFRKEPDKYQAALANSYTYQMKCPVMGGDVNPQSFATLAGGQKIYFCCPGCETPLFKDPAKYAPKLAAQGFKYDPAEMKHGEDSAKSDPHDHGSHDHGHDGHDHDH